MSIFIDTPSQPKCLINDQYHTLCINKIQSMYSSMAMKQQIIKYGDERYSTKCLQQQLYVSYQLQYSLCETETYIVSKCYAYCIKTKQEQWLHFDQAKRITCLQAITRLSDLLNRHLSSSVLNRGPIEPHLLDIDIAYLISSTSCPVLEYYFSMAFGVCSQEGDDVIFYAMFPIIEYLLKRHFA